MNNKSQKDYSKHCLLFLAALSGFFLIYTIYAVIKTKPENYGWLESLAIWGFVLFVSVKYYLKYSKKEKSDPKVEIEL